MGRIGHPIGSRPLTQRRGIQSWIWFSEFCGMNGVSQESTRAFEPAVARSPNARSDFIWYIGNLRFRSEHKSRTEEQRRFNADDYVRRNSRSRLRQSSRDASIIALNEKIGWGVETARVYTPSGSTHHLSWCGIIPPIDLLSTAIHHVSIFFDAGGWTVCPGGDKPAKTSAYRYSRRPGAQIRF